MSHRARSTAQPKAYCNVLAKDLGLDAAGYATTFETAVFIETPLPWREDLYQQEGAFPDEVVALWQRWVEQYLAGVPLPALVLAIAPDAEYSHEEHRRVIFANRTDGPISRFDKVEYLVPSDQAGPLIWTWFEQPDTLHEFADFLEPVSTPDGRIIRDLLVCTHGTVEIACAKFGYPLYKRLRDEHAAPGLRVWRVSHFGEHVFAPTMLDMPRGHSWAYVDPDTADQIASQDGDVQDLYWHYRGWAGLEAGFPQAAERAMWQREGWDWFEFPKQCTVLDSGPDDANPQWMSLRVDFTRSDGRAESYLARVEVEREIETVPTTDYPESMVYRQYRVSDLVHGTDLGT
ncbi:MAG: sucrase ferredoxin [Chloroflexota bacterium]